MLPFKSTFQFGKYSIVVWAKYRSIQVNLLATKACSTSHFGCLSDVKWWSV